MRKTGDLHLPWGLRASGRPALAPACLGESAHGNGLSVLEASRPPFPGSHPTQPLRASGGGQQSVPTLWPAGSSCAQVGVRRARRPAQLGPEPRPGAARPAGGRTRPWPPPLQASLEPHCPLLVPVGVAGTAGTPGLPRCLGQVQLGLNVTSRTWKTVSSGPGATAWPDSAFPRQSCWTGSRWAA